MLQDSNRHEMLDRVTESKSMATISLCFCAAKEAVARMAPSLTASQRLSHPSKGGGRERGCMPEPGGKMVSRYFESKAYSFRLGGLLFGGGGWWGY